MNALLNPDNAPLFAEAFKFAVSKVSSPAEKVLVSVFASLKGYGKQLEETNLRVSTFKSFADPSKPVSLFSHYVTTSFHESNDKNVRFDQNDLLEKLLEPGRYVVSATAGFGKSMALRYLALALYETPRGRIPLFLELRHLNRVTTPNLLAFLHQSYAQGSKVSLESLKQGMKSGAFVLIFDGFDELSHEIRQSIEDQIIRLARDFPEVSIVVSGRPDERFNSWRDFTVLKICPMSITQIVELLDKLDYDSGVKKRFIKKVQNGLYESHQSFLSTPLLAILMLLTFERNSNIPEKLHLFYAKAFETLFEKHDATKEQHERSRKTDLALDQFQSLFATFCLNSYVREMTEFEHTEVLRIVRESIKFQSLSVSAEDFLFDIEESVCLMMREGGSFFFVHRSFQEYFTAVFLSQCSEETRNDFLNNVAIRHWDSVLGMLFEMARDQLEPTWIASQIHVYLSKVGKEKDKIGAMQARFKDLEIHMRDGNIEVISISPGPFNKLLLILRRFYPEINGHVSVNFDVFQDYFSGEGAALLSSSESKSSRKGRLTTQTLIPIDTLPKEVLRNSGFTRLCEFEFKTVQSIGERITKDQDAKGKFLHKLFGSA